MEKINFLLADKDIHLENTILPYFKEKYNLSLLKPSSFDDLFTEPYLNSSIAIVESAFSGDRGLEALKSLKTLNPSLPIIFTTSQDTEELCLCAYKLGARDCFKKPYIFIDIIQSIELILKSKKEGTGYRSNILSGKNANSLTKRPGLQKSHPNIEQAKKYIEENLSKSFSLDDLAAQTCLSKFHFCRVFKRHESMTCSEYLNLLRIRKAKTLLKNDCLSISEIFYLTGYNDLAYFGRVFKTLEGVSPSAYRKKISS
tara:strand:+ start:3441 stop:4211 length:771 start_codon:yes stop_codon:yes gene_type:complete